MPDQTSLFPSIYNALIELVSNRLPVRFHALPS